MEFVLALIADGFGSKIVDVAAKDVENRGKDTDKVFAVLQSRAPHTCACILLLYFAYRNCR